MRILPRALYSALVLALFLHLADCRAECRTTSFDNGKFEEQLRRINGAASNLKSLQMSPASRTVPFPQTSTLALAGVYLDRTATEGFWFNSLLLLGRDMVDPRDLAHINLMIATQADEFGPAIKGYADYLTTLATTAPLFAGEIRTARDLVRQLEEMFLCAQTAPKRQ